MEERGERGGQQISQDCQLGGGEGGQSVNNVFSTMEEVPPILLFFGRKGTGDWVSQSTHPEAPGRGLAGGRWSGLTPPISFL